MNEQQYAMWWCKAHLVNAFCMFVLFSIFQSQCFVWCCVLMFECNRVDSLKALSKVVYCRYIWVKGNPLNFGNLIIGYKALIWIIRKNNITPVFKIYWCSPEISYLLVIIPFRSHDPRCIGTFWNDSLFCNVSFLFVNVIFLHSAKHSCLCIACLFGA